MRTNGERKSVWGIFLLLGLFVVFLSLRIGNYNSLEALLNDLTLIKSTPFDISITSQNLKLTVVVLLFYIGACVLFYLSQFKTSRVGEEYGSAEWGNVKDLVKYKQKNTKENGNNKIKNQNNIILGDNTYLGLNAKEHRRNLNVLLVGGSGAGKTRFYAKPNILHANTSYIVLDPKGELRRDTAEFLKSEGYEIKILDLLTFKNTNYYNPFTYIRNYDDIQRLARNLVQNTSKKGEGKGDPFWDQTAEMLLVALITYLWEEAVYQEQNFSMVLEMLRQGEVGRGESNLDLLFKEAEELDIAPIARQYYKAYRSGGDKTLQSIQISLLAKLEKFILPSLSNMTQTDDIELDKIGKQKTVLYCVIPDNDTSYNFIVGMLYTQLFQILYEHADGNPSGELEVPVHFVMDEFANVALPDDFQSLLSTMRSRRISCSIILQNISQLKTLFKDDWESIIGNCDTFLYLGNNEQETHKYVSEMLGKETIHTKTRTITRSSSGSSSSNEGLVGRELLTPSEVRELDNSKEIIVIRGEKPVIDDKYDLLKHPNYKKSGDMGEEYQWMPTQVERWYEKLNVEIIENIEKLESIEDGIITIDFMPRNSRIYVYSSDTLNALDE